MLLHMTSLVHHLPLSIKATLLATSPGVSAVNRVSFPRRHLGTQATICTEYGTVLFIKNCGSYCSEVGAGRTPSIAQL